MKINQFIGFRVTDYENGIIRSKSKNSGRSVSEYVRLAALEKKIIRIDGLGDILSELKRIGNNINQLTVIMRTRDIQNVDLREIKTDIGNLMLAVNTALQRGNGDGDYQDGERKVG